MSSIDEEVARAERMALAVASKPNLRVKQAKKIIKKDKKKSRRSRSADSDEHVQFQIPEPLHNDPIPNRKRLDSADEEVRRAREMALAVAALGTEKEAMKAEDIRMAIADVMTEETKSPKPRIQTLPKNQSSSAQMKSKTESASSSPQTEQKQQPPDGKTPDGTPDLDESDSATPATILEELMRPPWILRNQSVFATVALANLLILYVAMSSAPRYTKLSNAVFIFNTAVSVFCVVDKRDPQNNNVTTIVDSETDTDDDDESDEEIKRKQEALVDEMEKRIRPEKNIQLEWLADVHYSDSDLQSLLELQPESTLAERRRFLKARKGVIKAASAQLGSYLQWRSKNKIDEFFPSTNNFTTDEEDWALAARGAMEIANTKHSPARNVPLPRIVSVYGGNDGLVLCRNGARIVHVLPSQLDTTIAPATTYALALAMYLERKIDRNHTEKVTVVIDIRSGRGWPNPSSVSLVPFIKLVVGSLNSYFPERLSRCILFPLPMTATVIFNKAKAYLDPDTATKIQVCSGAGSVSSAVPSKVKNFIDETSIEKMEKRRIAFFRP